MAVSLLSTKLYAPPRRSGAVLRPRLVERLNEALHHRLVLISAPAGFGKTTLLSEWLAQGRDARGARRETPGDSSQHETFSPFPLFPSRVAWLSLDAGDRELARFLVYLVAALQTAAPELGAAARALLQSPQPPPAEVVLTALLSEIAAAPGDLVLVLDDYHLVDAEPIDAALTFLVEHLPPQLHLVIATREDPRLPLARLRARGQLAELRAADLRFSPAESAEFLNHTMGLSLTADDIAALDARTEGWAAGLQLAALSLQGRADTAGFIRAFAGSHRFVLDYLLEEVLQRQPADVQSFLLHTAILERMCGPLCDAVLENREPPRGYPTENKEPRNRGTAEPGTTQRVPDQEPRTKNQGGESTVNSLDREATIENRQSAIEHRQRSNAQTLLEHLDRANLFVVPLDDRRQWYRYHHLFAEVLLARLVEGQPYLLPALHERASRWYEQNGMRADAIRHALAAEDFGRAAALIELAWPAAEASSQTATWLGWVKRLPAELVRARPVLSVWYAYALLGDGKIEAAETWLTQAERWLEPHHGADRRTEDPADAMVVADDERFRSLPAAIAVARAYRAQALGDIPATVGYARRALELAAEEDQLRSGQATALLGLTYWASGDLEAADRIFAAFTARLRLAGSLADAISTAFVLAEIRVALGRGREAARALEQLLQDALEQGEPLPPGTADLYRGLAELCRERGDLEAATRHLLTSRALSQQDALLDWRRRLRVSEARMRQTEGRLDEALVLLDEAERMYIRTPLPDVRPIAALRARIWDAQGRLAEAQGWARERGLAADDQLSYMREFEHITLARLQIARYRSSRAGTFIREAARLLERLLAAAEAGGRMGSVLEILVLQALVHHAQGDTALALAPLTRALSLAEPEGYVRIFLDEGPPMARLLHEAAARGVAPEHTRQLLAAFSPAEPPGARAAGLEPLSERELEVLRQIAAGLTNREIAGRLYLSLYTVKAHARSIYDKLGASNRTQAVAIARELGLLPLRD